jgi:hypothetical protein
MTERTRLGGATLLAADDPLALVAGVEDEIARGEHDLCIDATGLVSILDPETMARTLRVCASRVIRARGHLTVICPFGPARTALARTGLPVLSDRSIAQAVLS